MPPLGATVRGTMFRHLRFPVVLVASATLAFASTEARPARACGGCFHQPPPPNPPPNEVETVVTDHRMAFAVSPTQTVLWDQIRYTGNPSDFAWVLPVRPGTQVQLSHDAWLAALDASTATVIEPPPLPTCAPPNYGGGGGDNGGYYGDDGGSGYSGDYGGGYGGSGGCGCLGTASSAGGAGLFSGGAEADASSYSGESGSSSGGGTGGVPLPPPQPPPVTVTTQETVGPYEVVVVHSSKGEALDQWLMRNGYAVPASITPILQAYIAAKMDFVALKLAPGATVSAMQPVRVIEPGADLTLPLRMISAGAGAHVGITLWVISEGRYHPQNFPDVAIDFTQLQWDVRQSLSTYSQLEAQALASQGGSGWLTQFAGPATLMGMGSNGLTPGLLDAYQQTCTPEMPANPCDAGTPEAGDASGGEASTDDASTEAGGEASAEAGEPETDAQADGFTGDAASEAGEGGASSTDAGGTGCVPPAPIACDDPDVALAGLQPGSVWITRLVATLPASALGNDLMLEATTSQTVAPNVHQAVGWFDGDPCTMMSRPLLLRARSGAGGGANGGGGRADSCALGSAESGAGPSDGAIVCAVALVLAWGKRRRAR